MIIGAGTGRCGTISLSKLLNNCDSANITHEVEPHLPWNADEWLGYYKKRLDSWRKEDKKYIGDIASYYLPYLQTYLPEDMLVIILKREKEEVVESFMEVSGPFNNWQKNWTGRYNPIYGPCFPKFDVNSKKEGLESYWDYYYKQAEELESRYSNQVKIFDINKLNSEKGQRKILNQAGVEKQDQEVKIPCRFNQRK